MSHASLAACLRLCCVPGGVSERGNTPAAVRRAPALFQMHTAVPPRWASCEGAWLRGARIFVLGVRRTLRADAGSDSGGGSERGCWAGRSGLRFGGVRGDRIRYNEGEAGCCVAIRAARPVRGALAQACLARDIIISRISPQQRARRKTHLPARARARGPRRDASRRPGRPDNVERDSRRNFLGSRGAGLACVRQQRGGLMRAPQPPRKRGHGTPGRHRVAGDARRAFCRPVATECRARAWAMCAVRLCVHTPVVSLQCRYTTHESVSSAVVLGLSRSCCMKPRGHRGSPRGCWYS